MTHPAETDWILLDFMRGVLLSGVVVTHVTLLQCPFWIELRRGTRSTLVEPGFLGYFCDILWYKIIYFEYSCDIIWHAFAVSLSQ